MRLLNLRHTKFKNESHTIADKLFQPLRHFCVQLRLNFPISPLFAPIRLNHHLRSVCFPAIIRVVDHLGDEVIKVTLLLQFVLAKIISALATQLETF